MKKEIYLEQKEKEPFEADLRVDFIRHGKPEYSEEEYKAAKFEGVLKEEAIKEVGLSALELAEEIDKDKEIIVIWVSPRRRAQETAEIYNSVLEKQGINVLAVGTERRGPKIRTKETLRAVALTTEFVKETETKGINDWLEYWAKAEKLPEGVEKPEEVKKRVNRVMAYLERIARGIQPEQGKKLHFLCFGHEELFVDLLKEAYGIGTKSGEEGPTYGERMRIDILKSTLGKDAIFDMDYRNKKAKLYFNKEKREFRSRE